MSTNDMLKFLILKEEIKNLRQKLNQAKTATASYMKDKDDLCMLEYAYNDLKIKFYEQFI